MKKIRNILSLALVFIMLIGLMPMNVFAEPEIVQNPGTPGKTDEPAPTEKTDEEKLNEAKDAAKTEIGNLPNLSDTEKDEFRGKIDKAADENAVKEILAKANEKNEANKAKKVEKFTVTFNTDGKAKVDPAEVESGKTVAAPTPAPTAKGFKFEGWFEDKDLTKPYDFTKPVTKPITLFAKWSKVEEEKPGEKKPGDKEEKPGDKKPDDKKTEPEKKPEEKPSTPVNVVVSTSGRGTAYVDKPNASHGETVTVTATPGSGYVVSKIYFYDKGTQTTTTIKNYYNSYYYGYNGRYYNDYYRYYDDYVNYYYNKYDSYNDYLYYNHYSYYNKYDGYRYPDYDYYRYYDKYYGYYDDYYKYYDDYRDKSYKYSSYNNYLYNERYSHYKKYDGYRYWDYRYDDDDYRYWRNRYYYNGVNYTVSNTFTMPASEDVTVYVEFSDWSYYDYYYGPYYDDYYYYRARKEKKAEEEKAKEEKAKKEAEEAEAKAKEEANLPKLYENKAVITIGSTVLDKVSRDVHTVHAMDTAAYVKNGRVMLPLRYVAEALGLQVSWVANTKTVVIWDLTQRVEIPVKSNRIIVNGVTYTSDVKPEILNERTMLPIANIARALGLVDGSDIYWDQYNKKVTLIRKVLSK